MAVALLHFLALSLLAAPCLGALNTNDVFADNPPGITLMDFGDLRPGKINNNIDIILEKFGTSLPSKIDLGNIDDMFAYDCILLGLQNGIHREGDAMLESPDTAAIFLFGISTDKVTVECNWKTDLMILVFGGKIRANTDKVSIKANMTLEIEPGAEPKLQELKVTHMAPIYTEILGAGFFNWIGERFLDGMMNGARNVVIQQIENNVSARLQKSLSALKLPSLKK